MIGFRAEVCVLIIKCSRDTYRHIVELASETANLAEKIGLEE